MTLAALMTSGLLFMGATAALASNMQPSSLVRYMREADRH